VSKRAGRLRALGWLSAFLIVPEGVWLTASLQSGAREKSISNLSLEPVVVAALGAVVFVAWFLAAGKGLRPSVGIILLILLSAAALTLHRFVPGLRE
jgi:hypothetical protein